MLPAILITPALCGCLPKQQQNLKSEFEFLQTKAIPLSVTELLPHSLPLAWEGMALFGTLRNAVANRKMSATSRAGTVGSYDCFSIVGQPCREPNAPDGSFSQQAFIDQSLG